MVAAGRDICHFSSRKLILPKDNDMRKISCCQPSSYIVCIVGKKECIGINSVERKMTFISKFFQPKAIFFSISAPKCTPDICIEGHIQIFSAVQSQNFIRTLKAVVNKETKVRSLAAEKRTPPEMVAAQCLGFPLFPWQSTGHAKQADQNCRGASGGRKTHHHNVCQVEGGRETQRSAVLFTYTTFTF